MSGKRYTEKEREYLSKIIAQLEDGDTASVVTNTLPDDNCLTSGNIGGINSAKHLLPQRPPSDQTVGVKRRGVNMIEADKTTACGTPDDDDTNGLPPSATNLTGDIFPCCPYWKSWIESQQKGDAHVISRGQPDDVWWSVEQAGAYLNLTPRAVREGAAKGWLPGHKYPVRSPRGRWRFKKIELDKSLMKPAPPRKKPADTIWN
jgi:hypothetical protein